MVYLNKSIKFVFALLALVEFINALPATYHASRDLSEQIGPSLVTRDYSLLYRRGVSCRKCTRVFATNPDREAHERKHDQLLECDHCKGRFDDLSHHKCQNDGNRFQTQQAARKKAAPASMGGQPGARVAHQSRPNAQPPSTDAYMRMVNSSGRQSSRNSRSPSRPNPQPPSADAYMRTLNSSGRQSPHSSEAFTQPPLPPSQPPNTSGHGQPAFGEQPKPLPPQSEYLRMGLDANGQLPSVHDQRQPPVRSPPNPAAYASMGLDPNGRLPSLNQRPSSESPPPGSVTYRY